MKFLLSYKYLPPSPTHASIYTYSTTPWYFNMLESDSEYYTEATLGLYGSDDDSGTGQDNYL